MTAFSNALKVSDLGRLKVLNSYPCTQNADKPTTGKARGDFTCLVAVTTDCLVAVTTDCLVAVTTLIIRTGSLNPQSGMRILPPLFALPF